MQYTPEWNLLAVAAVVIYPSVFVLTKLSYKGVLFYFCMLAVIYLLTPAVEMADESALDYEPVLGDAQLANVEFLADESVEDFVDCIIIRTKEGMIDLEAAVPSKCEGASLNAATITDSDECNWRDEVEVAMGDASSQNLLVYSPRRGTDAERALSRKISVGWVVLGFRQALATVHELSETAQANSSRGSSDMRDEASNRSSSIDNCDKVEALNVARPRVAMANYGDEVVDSDDEDYAKVLRSGPSFDASFACDDVASNLDLDGVMNSDSKIPETLFSQYDDDGHIDSDFESEVAMGEERSGASVSHWQSEYDVDSDKEDKDLDLGCTDRDASDRVYVGPASALGFYEDEDNEFDEGERREEETEETVTKTPLITLSSSTPSLDPASVTDSDYTPPATPTLTDDASSCSGAPSLVSPRVMLEAPAKHLELQVETNLQGDERFSNALGLAPPVPKRSNSFRGVFARSWSKPKVHSNSAKGEAIPTRECAENSSARVASWKRFLL